VYILSDSVAVGDISHAGRTDSGPPRRAGLAPLRDDTRGWLPRWGGALAALGGDGLKSAPAQATRGKEEKRDFIARTPRDGAEFSLRKPTRSSRRTFRDSESEQERTWKKRRRLAAFEMTVGQARCSGCCRESSISCPYKATKRERRKVASTLRGISRFARNDESSRSESVGGGGEGLD